MYLSGIKILFVRLETIPEDGSGFFPGLGVDIPVIRATTKQEAESKQTDG